MTVSNIPKPAGSTPGGGGPLLADSGMAGNALKSGRGPPAPGAPVRQFHIKVTNMIIPRHP